MKPELFPLTILNNILLHSLFFIIKKKLESNLKFKGINIEIGQTLQKGVKVGKYDLMMNIFI